MCLTIHTGDTLEVLRTLPDEAVHCCVTSPPYWGLRDYGVGGQIGLEKTPDAYVARMVEVFREVRRVLIKDGTAWVNLGDTYAGGGNGGGGSFAKDGIRCAEPGTDKNKAHRYGRRGCGNGIKPKDLLGIPWRVAFALQADGWYLRSDIIWAKPNPMPESVTDRPTKSHEYIFLLSKNQRYFYDAAAIREQQTDSTIERAAYGWNGRTDDKSNGARTGSTFTRMAETGEPIGTVPENGMRNKRTVWTVPTYSYKDAHFATYPPDLIKPCILAGCPVGGVVLDPFAGSGTTAMVALELGRKAIAIEINPEYVSMIQRRCNVTPGLPL